MATKSSLTVGGILLRAAILIPVAIACLLSTSIPRRLGLYRMMMELDPAGVGALPAYYPTGEDEWVFKFEDFYGDGPDPSKAEEYRNRLAGQTALVTGANSGTGYEVSLALARLGVRVTMACRNPDKCRQAATRIRNDREVLQRARDDRGVTNIDVFSKLVDTMTVDTSSLASVRNFCDEFLRASEGTALDMLFLNAGIPFRSPLPDGTNELSVDGIELTFATNVVGHHLMYKKLASLLVSQKDKPPPRIVLTSSASSYGVLYDYKVPTTLEQLNGDPIIGNGSSHYAQSKLAQILWARELTDALESAGPSDRDAPFVNAVHPGVVATSITSKNTFPNKLFEKIIHSLDEPVRPILWSPPEGALTLLYVGTHVADLEEYNYRGRYFHPQSQLVRDHKHVYDDLAATKTLQQKLWAFLDDLVKDYV